MCKLFITFAPKFTFNFSWVTDPMNVCVITRKSERPIVVSVQDHSVFTSIIDVKEKY